MSGQFISGFLILITALRHPVHFTYLLISLALISIYYGLYIQWVSQEVNWNLNGTTLCLTVVMCPLCSLIFSEIYVLKVGTLAQLVQLLPHINSGPGSIPSLDVV